MASRPRLRAHRTPGRHVHWRAAQQRHRLLRAGGVAALLAVVGPGLLAGLSDDDPAGITTYSILGARYGYELLWVLALSTAALIVFHELGVRLGDRHRQGPADAGAGALRRSGAGAAGRDLPGDRQHRHALRRVRRGRGGDGPADRDQPLRQRAAGGDRGLDPRPAGELPPGRAPAAGPQLGLRRLRRGGDPRPPRLGRSGAGTGGAEHPAQSRRAAGRGGDAGDDAGALGPRLHPVLRRRQAPAGGGPALRARSTSSSARC